MKKKNNFDNNQSTKRNHYIINIKLFCFVRFIKIINHIITIVSH